MSAAIARILEADVTARTSAGFHDLVFRGDRNLQALFRLLGLLALMDESLASVARHRVQSNHAAPARRRSGENREG